MLKTHRREKLLNAIVFFATNTEKCGKTKLFKLLYLLDFDHFKQTGRSVTGLEYYAWEKGPVPVQLNEELDEPSNDLFDSIEIEPERVFHYQRLKVVAKRQFDPAHFTKRELTLLERIAQTYRDATSDEMVDVTHAENEAWEKVWQGGSGRNHHISYALALDGMPDRDRLDKAARAYDETLKRVGVG